MNFIKQVMKYSMVGLINTGITIGTIFLLTEILSVNYIVANSIGYILGLTNSFFMNMFWTFKSSGNYRNQGVKFLIVFGICYFFQLFLLIYLNEVLNMNENFSQILAMIFYSSLNFILNKLYTFRN